MIHFHYCFFIIIIRPRHRSTLFPYTTLFRSARRAYEEGEKMGGAYHVLAWIVTWPMLAVCLHESDLDRAIELRSEEHTFELQSQSNLVCRLLLEKKNIIKLNET